MELFPSYENFAFRESLAIFLRRITPPPRKLRFYVSSLRFRRKASHGSTVASLFRLASSHPPITASPTPGQGTIHRSAPLCPLAARDLSSERAEFPAAPFLVLSSFPPCPPPPHFIKPKQPNEPQGPPILESFQPRLSPGLTPPRESPVSHREDLSDP